MYITAHECGCASVCVTPKREREGVVVHVHVCLSHVRACGLRGASVPCVSLIYKASLIIKSAELSANSQQICTPQKKKLDSNKERNIRRNRKKEIERKSETKSNKEGKLRRQNMIPILFFYRGKF